MGDSRRSPSSVWRGSRAVALVQSGRTCQWRWVDCASTAQRFRPIGVYGTERATHSRVSARPSARMLPGCWPCSTTTEPRNWAPPSTPPTGSDGARVAVVGRGGDGWCRGAVAEPDGVQDGTARDPAVGRVAERRGRLRAGDGTLRGDAERRRRDLALRAALPVRLRAGPAGAGRPRPEPECHRSAALLEPDHQVLTVAAVAW